MQNKKAPGEELLDKINRGECNLMRAYRALPFVSKARKFP